MGLEVPLMIGGMAMQGYGMYASSKAARQEGEMNARAAEWNATMSELEGEQIKKAATTKEAMLREDVRRTVGTGRAAAGASGFAMESVSTQKALEDIVRSGELDAAMIRYQGDIGQWEKQTQARFERAGGTRARAIGEAKASQAMYRGATTMLEQSAYLWGQIPKTTKAGWSKSLWG